MILTVLFMIFFHIIDDFYLQGWLASAKQKKFWQENAPEKMYRYDYILVLIVHSFSWSFMVMFPILIVSGFEVSSYFVVFLFANIIIHAIVDDLKANQRIINLWIDQLIHIMQILFTALVLIER